jgi:tRNA dimethylallyltransferase
VGGEVINADSMQVYIGMDIGTAKVAETDRGGVPHHLLDIWPVTRTASLSVFQDLALPQVDRLQREDQVPVLVGGSGMYVNAVVDRWQIPGTDPALRQAFESQLAAVGPADLHERLARVDPAAAATILPTDGRRIVRALEVVELDGSYTARLPPRAEASDLLLVGLGIDRATLDERIVRRVDRMWEQGFVDEVEHLVPCGLREGQTASRALGYAQVLAFLAGECTEQEARERTIRATRKFARRQESWFRKDERVSWLPYDATDLLERALELVADAQ